MLWTEAQWATSSRKRKGALRMDGSFYNLEWGPMLTEGTAMEDEGCPSVRGLRSPALDAVPKSRIFKSKKLLFVGYLFCGQCY